MKNTNHLAITILSILFIISCQAQKKLQAKTMDAIQLKYSDGNGNTYKVANDSLFYYPITPEMSSSGIYSGGDPVQKSITVKEFEKIQTTFNTVFKNSSIHIKNRIKTSGLLIASYAGNKKKKVIIKRSKEQELLEKVLKEVATD